MNYSGAFLDEFRETFSFCTAHTTRVNDCNFAKCVSGIHRGSGRRVSWKWSTEFRSFCRWEGEVKRREKKVSLIVGILASAWTHEVTSESYWQDPHENLERNVQVDGGFPENNYSSVLSSLISSQFNRSRGDQCLSWTITPFNSLLLSEDHCVITPNPPSRVINPLLVPTSPWSLHLSRLFLPLALPPHHQSSIPAQECWNAKRSWFPMLSLSRVGFPWAKVCRIDASDYKIARDLDELKCEQEWSKIIQSSLSMWFWECFPFLTAFVPDAVHMWEIAKSERRDQQVKLIFDPSIWSRVPQLNHAGYWHHPFYLTWRGTGVEDSGQLVSNSILRWLIFDLLNKRCMPLALSNQLRAVIVPLIYSEWSLWERSLDSPGSIIVHSCNRVG